jgi:hypothetical protein
MLGHLGLRFWGACGVAVAGAALTLLTLASPTWIELLFGIDPDAGSGALEWALAALPVAAIAGALLARVEWRRVRILNSAEVEPDRIH